MVDVVVVTGVGGMGVACARGASAQAYTSCSPTSTRPSSARSSTSSRADGFTVTGQRVDVSDPASVDALVAVVRGLGPLRTLVHTAGLSPTQASGERVLEVDMLGTDHVLNAFLDVVVQGTVAVCIASMAGSMAELPREHEHAVTRRPPTGSWTRSATWT